MPEKTKVDLFAGQLGICAASKCDNRIHVEQARLGECAHIIPRKVGSHPREDYQTPLEERFLPANLLYLCEKHHKIVDNPVLAATYTSDILRKWKAEHQEWASRVRKDPTYLSKELQERVNAAIAILGKGAQQSNELITKLLDASEEQIARGRFSEANAVLSQIDLILTDFENPEFVERSSTLSAVVAFKEERVHEAKKQLRSIIEANSEGHSAMFEYIEICEAAPEEGDEVENFEQIVTALYPQHPRLEILKTNRAARAIETAKENALQPFPPIENPFLRLRFYIHKAIVYDTAQDKKQRDELLQKMASEFPDAPRVDLYTFVFRAVDTLRKEPSKAALLECLAFSAHQKGVVAKKEPLPTRDRLQWDICDFRLRCALIRFGIVEHDLDASAATLMASVADCFADRYIVNILADLLAILRLPEQRLLCVIEQLKLSKVEAPEELLRRVFVQSLPHKASHAAVLTVLKNRGCDELIAISKAILSKDGGELSEKLNCLHDDALSVSLLDALEDKPFVYDVSSKLTVSDEWVPHLRFVQVEALSEGGQPEKAIGLIQTLDTDLMSPPEVGYMAKIAYGQEEWRVFIPMARKLCDAEMPPATKADLHARLALAYQTEGDDANAVLFAEKALADHTLIGEHNAGSMILVAARSLYLLGQADKACELFEKHTIQASLQLKLTNARMLLRSQRADRIEKASACIVDGFLLADTYTEQLFVSALDLLLELNDEIKNLDTAEIGTFVSLEGIGWIYLGDAIRALGAMPLSSGPKFDAVVGKRIGEPVQWPPDKYSAPGKERKILYILSPIAYLSARAHEGMVHLAQLGTEPIWAVQTATEDGSITFDYLKGFLAEQGQNHTDFFAMYCEKFVPFGFLAGMEGDVVKALSRICNEGKGFIHCNNGSLKDIEQQRDVAKSVLGGAQYVVDGLVALVLAEADLLKAVVSAVPNILIPVSVIRYLRTIASQVDPTAVSVGRGGLSGGDIKFTPRSIENERALYDKLIEAAAYLDGLPGKTMGRTVSAGVESGLPKAIPACLLEPLEIASERGVCILTDDSIMPEAYQMAEKRAEPEHFSSLALTRVLFENGKLTRSEYLRYFSILAGYRYHLLPISVQDLLDAVIPQSAGGISSFDPKNIEYFQLRFILSKEYGIDETRALGILSLFFIHIITDYSVTEDAADSIFAYTVVRYFGQAESKMQCGALKAVCQRQLEQKIWLSALTKSKYAIFAALLDRFSATYDPIFAAAPLLMKIVRG